MITVAIAEARSLVAAATHSNTTSLQTQALVQIVHIYQNSIATVTQQKICQTNENNLNLDPWTRDAMKYKVHHGLLFGLPTFNSTLWRRTSNSVKLLK